MPAMWKTLYRIMSVDLNASALAPSCLGSTNHETINYTANEPRPHTACLPIYFAVGIVKSKLLLPFVITLQHAAPPSGRIFRPPSLF